MQRPLATAIAHYPKLCDIRAVARPQRGNRLSMKAAATFSWRSPLVDGDTLQAHLQDVSILDVRGSISYAPLSSSADPQTGSAQLQAISYAADYEAYLEGHIPGATFLDFTRTSTSGQQNEEGGLLNFKLHPDEGAAMFEGRGVGTDRPVVVYDDGGCRQAARVWLALLVLGHPCPLVLQGGWQAWMAAGRESELYEPCTLKVYASFEPQQPAAQFLCSSAVLQSIESSTTLTPGSSAGSWIGIPHEATGYNWQDASAVALVDADSGVWAETDSLDKLDTLLATAGVCLPQTSTARPDNVKVATNQPLLLVCTDGCQSALSALALTKSGLTNWAVMDEPVKCSSG